MTLNSDEFVNTIINKINEKFYNITKPSKTCYNVMKNNINVLKNTIDNIAVDIIDFNYDNAVVETKFNDLNQYELWLTLLPTTDMDGNYTISELRFNIMIIGYSNNQGNIILY